MSSLLQQGLARMPSLLSIAGLYINVLNFIQYYIVLIILTYFSIKLDLAGFLLNARMNKDFSSKLFIKFKQLSSET